MHFFKHSYLKYFLLIILSIKGGYFVAENIASTFDVEISCTTNTGDFEHENEDKNEFDESEKIHQPENFSTVLKSKILNCKHSNLLENYLTRYLEFTTPPPELV